LIRRATPDDVDFLVGLLNHDEVEPYLSARRERDRDGRAGRVRDRDRRACDEKAAAIGAWLMLR
jgi:hypothetical protein